MFLAYRSDDDALQDRLDVLLEARRDEVSSVAGELRRIYARRVARSVAGGIAALGGAAMLLGGLHRFLVACGGWLSLHRAPDDGVLVGLLCGGAFAGGLAYLPARLAAGAAFDRTLRESIALTGNVRRDLLRLERARPREAARASIERLEAVSAALPLVAAALLGPLLLHLLAWLFATGGVGDRHLADFDPWIAASVPFAGLAHVVLATLGAQFAMSLAEKSTEDLLATPARQGWVAFGLTALAGMVPGAVLLLIPPLLVGLTGLLFIPLSFRATSLVVAGERQALEALDVLGP